MVGGDVRPWGKGVRERGRRDGGGVLMAAVVAGSVAGGSGSSSGAFLRRRGFGWLGPWLVCGVARPPLPLFFPWTALVAGWRSAFCHAHAGPGPFSLFVH